jgi:hypothetical protein
MSQRRLTNLLQRIADDVAGALQHGGDIPRLDGQAALARLWSAIRESEQLEADAPVRPAAAVLRFPTTLRLIPITTSDGAAT